MSRAHAAPRAPACGLSALALCAVSILFGAAPAAAKPPHARRARAEAGEAANPSAKERRARKKPAAAKPEPPPADSAPAEARLEAKGESRAESQRRAAQDAALGADAQVVREGETQVKVMSFEGLDIEGRLKSPQLLYFVGRVHAEFDRPTLPHRSFMPELEGSTHTAPLQ